MKSLAPSFVSRRVVLASLAACCAAVVMPAGAQGQSYPDRALKLVVPYPAGGTADVLAREIGLRLSKELGQPVVVENKAGAGATIGTRFVATSPADGYTLLIGTSTTHAINPAVNAGVGYDPIQEFTALAALGDMPYAIVAHPGKDIDSLKTLLEKGRSSQQNVPNYASAGPGSANHLGGVLLSKVTGASFLHVPYKGSAPALADVLAGHVDFMFDLVTTSKSAVAEGRLKALATTGSKRSHVLPQVPTVGELGLPAMEMSSWFGLFAPAGLPQDVRAKLEASLAKVLDDGETQAKLQGFGLSLMEQRGKAFGDFVAKDLAGWRKLAEESQLNLNNK